MCPGLCEYRLFGVIVFGRELHPVRVTWYPEPEHQHLGGKEREITRIWPVRPRSPSAAHHGKAGEVL